MGYFLYKITRYIRSFVNQVAHWKTYSTLQFLRGSIFPIHSSSIFCHVLLLPLNQGNMLQPAVTNVKRLSFFPSPKRRRWLRTGQESRWHPHLSDLFKEHCRQSPKSNKPTTCPGMISELPPLLSTLKILRFNLFIGLQIVALCSVTTLKTFSGINCFINLSHILQSPKSVHNVVITQYTT